VYAIVDPADVRVPFAATVDAILRAGARTVQARSKPSLGPAQAAVIRAVAPRVLEAGASLIINDDLELAERLFDVFGPGIGVHLGQEDLARHLGGDLSTSLRRSPGLIVGISTHHLGQVRGAVGHAPDYLGFGPVFATQSKPAPDPVVGIHRLSEAVSLADVPVVAIGGITHDSAGACIDAGAAAVAVISAIAGENENDVFERTRALVDSISR
jgi:thiamine-phosphate pyrophosphorylase